MWWKKSSGLETIVVTSALERNYILIFKCIIIIAAIDENWCRVHKRWDCFSFCLWAKFYFHTQICNPTLSSLVAQPQKNRKNLSIFLFSHFQCWLLHNILRFLIIVKYQNSLNRGFRVHPVLVMDGTLWPQHQGVKSYLFNLIPLLDNF